MTKINAEFIERELLPAVLDAIRYANLEGKSNHKRDNLAALHRELVKKAFRSQEMRSREHLPKSVFDGTDLGTHFTRENCVKVKVLA